MFHHSRITDEAISVVCDSGKLVEKVPLASIVLRFLHLQRRLHVGDSGVYYHMQLIGTYEDYTAWAVGLNLPVVSVYLRLA
jgi:hypothetical protein